MLTDLTETLRSEHPILREFSHWFGPIPQGFSADFVGQMIDLEFQSKNAGIQFERLLFEDCPHPTYPPKNEEIFEWIQLLSAILEARERFVMFELGAGYGYWSVAAACALRIKRPMLPCFFTAVEAEPTHFQWLNQHFINNGISPDEHHLIPAAIHGSKQDVHFVVGNAHEWYGQAIVSHPNYCQSDMPKSHTVQVPAISFQKLLSGIERVDYLDMDIQGAELSAIEAGITDMTRCVRRAFIATHSLKIDQNLTEIFTSFGWHSTCLYPCGTTNLTPFGEISFIDGAQCWVNPAIE